MEINRMIKSIVIAALLIVSSFLYSQGDTRYDSNMNLPFNQKAGDVNPQTGEISLSVNDLTLPGRGINFSFGRTWKISQSSLFNMTYNNGNALDSNTVEKHSLMGIGWRTSVPYIDKVVNDNYSVTNLFFGDGVYQIDSDNLSRDSGKESNIIGYDLLDLIVYRDQTLKYSDAGISKIETLKSKHTELSIVNERTSYYLLTLKDKSKYYFDSDGKLMVQKDKTGLNSIWYFYDSLNRLKVVLDTVGREIVFSYSEVEGNLLEVSWDVTYRTVIDGVRQIVPNEKRTIKYQYKKAEYAYPQFNFSSYGVTNFRDPYILTNVQTPYDQYTDNVGKTFETSTKYEYIMAESSFSYSNDITEKKNLNLLLKSVSTGNYIGGMDEFFLNKKVICYEKEDGSLTYEKDFYTGFIDSFKISKQYLRDRHNNRDIMPIKYEYYDEGSNNLFNCYQTVITIGGVKTTYTYKSSNHILDSVKTETSSFNEEKKFEYDQFRTKLKDVVKRNGQIIYTESFLYDKWGNPTFSKNRSGLEVLISYHSNFNNVPRETIRRLTVDGEEKDYKTETVIDELGRIVKQVMSLDDGSKIESSVKHDSYGNVIEQTDFKGHVSKIDYDEKYNCFPVRFYSTVTIPKWNNGLVNDWVKEPDTEEVITVQNLKKYNSDGSVWIEVDNEGYAIEHYYNLIGQEIRTVKPDDNDVQVVDFDENGENFIQFLISREDNPEGRMEIFYHEAITKTYSDVDRASGIVKVSAVQTNGINSTEREIDYGPNGEEYISEMTYDNLGRMIALTDKDASDSFITKNIHSTDVKKHDKTWLIMYDELNRQVQVQYPMSLDSKSSSPKKIIKYDDENNTITTRDPELRETIQKMDWAGNLVKLISKGDMDAPADQWQTYLYEYDELGRKVLFTDPKGIMTGYKYNERDLLVEQVFVSDKPNVPNRSDYMTYDKMGQIIKKVDRKGQISTFMYDSLGRNIKINHFKNSSDLLNNEIYSSVKTAFDNRGNAVRIDNDNLIEYYTYDSANRVLSLNRSLKDKLQSIKDSVATVWEGSSTDQRFKFNYFYNDAGMVTSMIYPDGSVHNFIYDNIARLSNISEKDSSEVTFNDFVSSINYNKSGVVTDLFYSNGIKQHWDFDNRKRISNISITNSVNETIKKMDYKLNKNGDILSINQNEYKYDGFNRIIGAKTFLPEAQNDPSKLVKESFGSVLQMPGLVINGVSIDYDPLADLNTPDKDGRINGFDHVMASLTDESTLYDEETFTYDKNGNRKTLNQNGDIYTYEYGERNRLVKIFLKKKGEDVAKEFINYSYDDNGNLIERVINKEDITDKVTFTYDTLNRLIQTTENENVTNYYYDNAGNRFIKKSANGDVTLYLRHGQIAVAMDVEVEGSSDTINGKINRYILSGDLTAGRVTKTVNKDNTVELPARSFYHLDHLNSTTVVTDSTGAIEANYTYRAFGEQLNKLQEKDAKYTYGGKELDTNTNLYYFNARFYDATIGRFINVDPIQDGTNWYIYCNNNPLNMVDPTGLKGDEVEMPVNGSITYDVLGANIFNLDSTDLSNLKEFADIVENNEIESLTDMDVGAGFHSMANFLVGFIPIYGPFIAGLDSFVSGFGGMVDYTNLKEISQLSLDLNKALLPKYDLVKMLENGDATCTVYNSYHYSTTQYFTGPASYTGVHSFTFSFKDNNGELLYSFNIVAKETLAWSAKDFKMNPLTNFMYGNFEYENLFNNKRITTTSALGKKEVYPVDVTHVLTSGE